MPASDDLIAESVPELSDVESGTATSDIDSLEARLAAVERTLTDGDTPVAKLADAETLHQRLDTVEQTLEELTERVSELEAASRALRGYAGGIRAVNEDVERRADLALAKAETIERSLSEEPGLQIERLHPDLAEQVDCDAASVTSTDESDSASNNSTTGNSTRDNSTSVDVPNADDSTDHAESPSETTSPAGRPDRSLSKRIRDVL